MCDNVVQTSLAQVCFYGEGKAKLKALGQERYSPNKTPKFGFINLRSHSTKLH